MMLCRHCQKNRANRPRGMCWHCYYTPGLRDLYPDTSKFARRGLADFNGPAAPSEPTQTGPYSEERIRIMEERAARGEVVKNPKDAKADE